MNFSQKKITASRNIQLMLRSAGQATDIGCLLIHGLADGSYIWNDLLRSLPSFCETHAIDLRGHGDSSSDPKLDYSIDAYVRDVEDALGVLSNSKFVLVGHSFGGDIAARIASRAKFKVAGLVLVDSGPTFDDHERDYIYQMMKVMFRPYGSRKEFIDFLAVNRPLLDQPTMENIAENALMLADGVLKLKCAPEVLEILLQDYDASWWREALLGLRIPALVVRGAGSAVVKKDDVVAMLRLLSCGSSATVPGAGHAVMTDNPREFEKVILSFVAQITQSSGDLPGTKRQLL